MENDYMNEDLGNAKKPGFDARLAYYDVLKKYMELLGRGILYDDLMIQYRALKGLFVMVKPYIKSEQAKEIKSKLNTAFRHIEIALKPNEVSSQTFKMSSQKFLDDANELIHDYAKHMMLPLKEDEEDEFDMAKFLKDSDLG